jgi:hypothetical protein
VLGSPFRFIAASSTRGFCAVASIWAKYILCGQQCSLPES